MFFIRAHHVLFEIGVVDWKIDVLVVLFPSIRVLGEALKANYEEFWNVVELHLFNCQDMSFAVFTIPLISSFKFFRLGKGT